MSNFFNRNLGHPGMFGDFGTHWHMVRHHPIERRYMPKATTLLLVSALTAPWRIAERVMYRSKIEATPIEYPPIFIVGHWRSGTTWLHQLLSLDERFGYVTMFQTIAPGLLNIGQRTIKPLLRSMIPEGRPGDGMKMTVDGPQEEEHALLNMSPMGFYHHFTFPQQQRELFQHSVLMDDISVSDLETFKSVYQYTMKAATRHSHGKQLVVKNPPNTGRIPILLAMFPNAKFIHIYRNPYTVYFSTMKLYKGVHEFSQLQSISDEQLSEDILYFYDAMMHKFFEDKALIPDENFSEVRFEHLEQDPVGEIKRLYDELNLGGFEAMQPYVEQEMDARKGYRKNRFQHDPATLALLRERWGFAIDRWGYDIP